MYRQRNVHPNNMLRQALPVARLRNSKMGLIWEVYKDEFAPGSGRLLVRVEHTNRRSWKTLLTYLAKTEARLDYHLGGRKTELPQPLDDLFDTQAHESLLLIGLGGIRLRCERFVPGLIELSVDPAEVRDELQATVLFRLMSTTGRKLARKVVLTRKGSPDDPIFEYRPGTGIRYLRLGDRP
jgi:hypothetical protein